MRQPPPLAAASITAEQIVAATIHLPPEPDGHYELGEHPYAIRFPILRKPNALRRWFMRVLLGFRWRDA